MAEANRSRTWSTAQPRNGRQAPRAAAFRTASDCGTLSGNLRAAGRQNTTRYAFPEPLAMCPVNPPSTGIFRFLLGNVSAPDYFFQLLTIEQIRAADATTRADYSINVFNPEEKALME